MAVQTSDQHYDSNQLTLPIGVTMRAALCMAICYVIE